MLRAQARAPRRRSSTPPHPGPRSLPSARLQLEEALDSYRSARQQLVASCLVSRSTECLVSPSSRDPVAAELRARALSQATSAVRSTAVPPLLIGEPRKAPASAAAALAISVRTVVAALRWYVVFTTASAWAAAAGAGVGSLTDILRRLPRRDPLTRALGDQLQRAMGSSYVPKRGLRPSRVAGPHW